MFLNSIVQPEINATDLFAPVLARARVKSVEIDADGRVRVVLEAEDEVGLFDQILTPSYTGVLI